MKIRTLACCRRFALQEPQLICYGYTGWGRKIDSFCIFSVMGHENKNVSTWIYGTFGGSIFGLFEFFTLTA